MKEEEEKTGRTKSPDEMGGGERAGSRLISMHCYLKVMQHK